MTLTWKSTPIHFDPALTPDETAVVMLNNNSTVAGIIHNIGPLATPDDYTWQRYMEQTIADEMTLPHPGINDIFIDN